jgi:hypothetical protein
MVAAFERCLSVVADGVQQRKRQRYVHRLWAAVVHFIRQNRHRQAGIVNAERNERIKSLERQCHRKRTVFEINLGHGIGTGETCFLKMRQTLRGCPVEAIPAPKWRLRRAFEDPHFGRAAFRPSPQRHEAERQDSPLGRSVENLPIAQFATRPERDRAGSNSAQRKRYFSARPLDKGSPGSVLPEECLSRIRNGRTGGRLKALGHILGQDLFAGQGRSSQGRSRGGSQKLSPIYPCLFIHDPTRSLRIGGWLAETPRGSGGQLAARSAARVAILPARGHELDTSHWRTLFSRILRPFGQVAMLYFWRVVPRSDPPTQDAIFAPSCILKLTGRD